MVIKHVFPEETFTTFVTHVSFDAIMFHFFVLPKNMRKWKLLTTLIAFTLIFVLLMTVENMGLEILLGMRTEVTAFKVTFERFVH